MAFKKLFERVGGVAPRSAHKIGARMLAIFKGGLENPNIRRGFCALAGLPASLAVLLLMSHNVSAYSGLGNYTGFTSQNIRNSLDTANLSQLNQGAYTQVIFKYGTNEIYRGNFSNSVHFYAGQDIYLTLIFTFATSQNLTFPTNAGVTLVPAGDNNQFYTVYDNVDFELRSCNETSTSMSASCMFVLTHNIKLHADYEYEGVLRVQGASPFRVFSNYEVNAGIVMYGYLFNSQSEFSKFQNRFETYAQQNHQDITGLIQYIDAVESRLQYANDRLYEMSVDIDDIADDTSAISNKLNQMNQNAQAENQAWNNMQNTDGLVDVGDNTNFMSSFNAVNNFLGGIKNATPTNCVINANLGNLDLGELDACQLPSEIRTVIQTVAGIVFAVFDFLILWNSIKYIIGVINWARSN